MSLNGETYSSQETETLMNSALFSVTPYKNSVYFYIQSQSPRAWATFVTPVVEKEGIKYDSSVLQVEVEPPDEDKVVPVMVEVKVFQHDDSLRVEDVNKHRVEGFRKLPEVRFKNGFPKSPLTLAVGPPQYEAWKFTAPPGYVLVSVIPLIRTVQPDLTSVVLEINLF